MIKCAVEFDTPAEAQRGSGGDRQAEARSAGGPGHAFPGATGSAQYQSQPGQRELQLEVEHLRSLAGKRVAISVNGAVTGSAKVSAAGIAQFDRNTELAQKVPTIVHGATVTVRTSTGTLVASGRF